jgi:CRISPR-associated endonuclease Cas2
MARAPKKEYSLAEKLQRIKAKGIQVAHTIKAEDLLPDLSERIQQILQIVKTDPLKSTEMTYLIMYDISDDKVRVQISKYLLKNGCIRIQKSVFMLRSANVKFEEIHNTLKEVNSYYENQDSIILVPVNSSDVRSMKLIGKNVNVETITDKPNTLFF